MADNTNSKKPKIIKQIIVTAIAVILVMILSTAMWAKNNIYNSDRFAEQIVTAVQKEDVRLAIGAEVSDKLYQDNLVLRKVLAEPTQSLVASLLNNEKFSNILTTMATKLSERVTNGKTEAIVIDVSGFTSGIKSVATILSPDTNINLPQGEAAKITIIEANALPDLKVPGQVAMILAPFAAISLLLLLVIAWFKSKDKLQLIKLCGIGASVSGGLLLILTSTVGAQLALLATNANQTTILNSIYSEFTVSFNTYQTWLVVAGVVILIFVYLIKRKELFINLSNKLRKNK